MIRGNIHDRDKENSTSSLRAYALGIAEFSRMGAQCE